MKRVGLTVLAVCTLGLPTPSPAFDDMQRELIRLFKQAIVKVEVSGEVPQFDSNGVDSCRSQGMGFLISRTHLISAKHVIDVPGTCKKRIAVSSAATSFQSMTDVVDSHGDVVLLKLRDSSAPAPMCSLAVSDRNVYFKSVVRFALPGPLVDPEPLLTEIGDKSIEFDPNVRFTPAPVHPGDSGGPIVHLFSVVGITKEKLTEVDGYGVMIPVDPINKLLQQAAFRPDSSTCNPLLTQQTAVDVTFSSDLLKQGQIRTGLETALTGMSYSFNRFGNGSAAIAPAAADDNQVLNIPGSGTIMVPPIGNLQDGPKPSPRFDDLDSILGGNVFGGDNSVIRNLELPRLPEGSTVNSSPINPNFGTITMAPDQRGVAVIKGSDYPEIATEFLAESLKSQIWTGFLESLKSPASP